jgi:hypothetical protein
MQRKTITAVLSLAALVLLLVGGTAFLYWKGVSIPGLSKTSPSVLQIQQQMIGGDFATLTQDSTIALQNAPNQKTYDTAQAAQAYAEFMQGTSAGRLDGVRIAKDRYTSAKTDAQKGSAIDQLIQFVTVSRTNEVYGAVFYNPPFNVYYKKDDYTGTIARLAQESYNYQPSLVSAFYRILPYEAALTNWDKIYTLTADQKKADVQAIKGGLPLLDAAYASEKAATAGSPLAVLVPYTYYNWESILYSAMTTVDSQYAPNARQSFESLFSYYDSTKGADGRAPAILELRIYENYLSYARFLMGQGTPDDLTQARAQLAALVQTISADPQLHEHGYIAYLRSVAKQQGSSATQTAVVRQLKLYANLYPPFGDFVGQYGVVLK